MKIHPAADIFPMMRDDELKDLAADIKANGLLNPIVTWIDKDGDIDKGAKGTEYLLDGRNRQVACKISGIKPTTVVLANGHDPTAYIMSANIARRHMTKGQRAMAVAMIYPEPEKGGRGKKGANLKLNLGFSTMLLSQARTVLANGRAIAESVLKGDEQLGKAYETVQRLISETESDEKRLHRLRDEAPDVAELVDAGKITLAAGVAEVTERQRRELEAKEHARRSSAILENEMSGHITNVMAGIKFGEKKLVDRKKINKLIEQLKILLEELK